EPPRTGALSQEILTNLHRDRIDAADAVPHQLREERDALRVDDQAVRLRVCGPHRHQLDLARGWSQPANHVPLLHGEPERALLVEDRRVRTTRRWIGDLVFRDHARFGIEFTEVSVQLAGIPDVPILVGYEPMRPHAVGKLCVIGPEWIVPDFTGAWIETTQAAARLARIPNGAVGPDRGIVRTRARCDLPLSDRCLDGSRDPYT